jgi:tight adherence protein C
VTGVRGEGPRPRRPPPVPGGGWACSPSGLVRDNNRGRPSPAPPPASSSRTSWVYSCANAGQESIRHTLPDILDTLTVSVEAGLGFDAALAQVTRYGRGPLAGEFARVLQEMQIGRSRVDALRGPGRRTNVTELRSFCAIVVQATELGVPIANVLREQAREMRIRRRQRAEELAQKVPVKILFPLIFCLFPAVFIVVLGPGVINMIDLFKR